MHHETLAWVVICKFFPSIGLAPTGDMEIQNPNFVGGNNGNDTKKSSEEKSSRVE
jgi:hypothetical protein